AIRLTFFLEARKGCAFGKEVGVSPLQVLERLLQRMHGCICQPCGFCAVAPRGEQLAKDRIAQLLFAVLVPFLLQRQRLVEDETARTSEAAHLPLLLAVWPKLVFVGLKSLHISIMLLAYER